MEPPRQVSSCRSSGTARPIFSLGVCLDKAICTSAPSLDGRPSNRLVPPASTTPLMQRPGRLAEGAPSRARATSACRLLPSPPRKAGGPKSASGQRAHSGPRLRLRPSGSSRAPAPSEAPTAAAVPGGRPGSPAAGGATAQSLSLARSAASQSSTAASTAECSLPSTGHPRLRYSVSRRPPIGDLSAAPGSATPSSMATALEARCPQSRTRPLRRPVAKRASVACGATCSAGRPTPSKSS
mmetsp:Transcript_175295/g.562233  ORF Transcript_175295/g.562233 Transcript_175295/m.562233 type:complete len:240 (+) Transcript_175295:313-1032(+)